MVTLVLSAGLHVRAHPYIYLAFALQPRFLRITTPLLVQTELLAPSPYSVTSNQRDSTLFLYF